VTWFIIADAIFKLLLVVWLIVLTGECTRDSRRG
jgi:hypothetical protein